MKRGLALLVAVAVCAVMSSAQVAGSTQQRPSTPPAAVTAPDPVLTQVLQAAIALNGDLAAVQINKWKADGSVKRQAASNADSVQRNISDALPAMVQAAQAAPQQLAPAFKVYRNLNALYDVMISLTESAGAFGKKEEYEALARDTQQLDAARHALADRLESMALARDSEVVRLRTQARQAAPAPKKIVVDDTAPTKKSRKKKEPAASPQ